MTPEPLPNATESSEVVAAKLRYAWPTSQWRNVHVVLAASGGADSMTLLRAMLAVKAECGGVGRLFVVHVDHQLRGDESTADAEWIAQECESLRVPLSVCHCSAEQLASNAHGDGLEAAARSERYRLLTETAERLGARYVATGHTFDDQAETVLFRLLRGSGIRGLAGMAPSRPLGQSVTLVRPLLACRRAELLAYLQSLGQLFRDDASNSDRRFTRNRIRHDLLPRLRSDYNAEIDAALVRLAEQAFSAQQFIEAEADRLLLRCAVEIATERCGSEQGSCGKPASTIVLAIETAPLAEQPELLVCEALRLAWRRASLPEQAMTHRWWQQLAALARRPAAQSTPGLPIASGQSAPFGLSLNLPGNIQAQRVDSRLVLSAF